MKANDTTRLKFGLSAAGIWGQYFLIEDGNNIDRIKPDPIWLNSGLSLTLNLDYSRISYFIGLHKVDRNFTVHYNDVNNIKETYYAKSYLSCVQLGLDYKLRESELASVYLTGSMIFGNGWYLTGQVEGYNVLTKQSTRQAYYPDHTLNGKLFAISPGLRLDINLFKHIVYWRSRLAYAQNLNSSSFGYGTNRILLSAGIGLSYKID